MDIKCFEMNMFQENCYVVYDHTHEAVIIDPGCYYEKDREILAHFITSRQLIVKHLINTHLHIDHIFGNSFIEKNYHVVTEAHAGDLDWLEKAPERSEMLGIPWINGEPVKIGKLLTENDTVSFGESSFQIIHVPGHSPGSICFYSEDSHVVFSGDVLFRDSVGRADLPGGNWDALLNNIQKKLFILPDNTLVYPGHGHGTTIGREKEKNPFF